jgi:hypothetical protein
MERRFPDCELRFYPVKRDLTCVYPAELGAEEALVFIHYFGFDNAATLPFSTGTILEDLSHAYLSSIDARGDYVFGSYRKLVKVVDGGFVRGSFNPVYEPSRKLDCWLRLEAEDWRDVREAENMLDRQWALCDISSQALAVLLTVKRDVVTQHRQCNERFLFNHLSTGVPFRPYMDHECPMVHNRLLSSTEERDSLRKYLAGQSIFTSIHWPTHACVHAAADDVDITDTLWLERHILSIPIAEDYGQSDMERIVEAVDQWQRAGA